MDVKYSPENIKQALNFWGSERDNSPTEHSIISRFLNPSSPTTFFIRKKYPLYNIPILPSHFFVVVDGKEFHPGSETTPIFDTPSNPEDSFVMSLEEKCYYCSYHSLVTMFESDRNYSFAFNNCQHILGERLESHTLLVAIACSVVYIVTGKLSFGLFALLLVVFVILRENISGSSSSMDYTGCPHVVRLTN